MKNLLNYFTATFLVLSFHFSFSQELSKDYVLQDVTIIDAYNPTGLIQQTIIIQNGKINDIFPMNSKKLPINSTEIWLTGKYIIPGLIDTHVHLATDPSGVDYRSKSEYVLKEMLYRGITSVRDMAGDGRALASLSRDALVGDIDSPNIYFAALMAGPEFFKDPRTEESSRGGIAGTMPYMKAITDSTNLELAIAEAKGTGASGIKLYMFISGELAKKVVTEAKKQNMQIWSHASLQLASLEEVVSSGVHSISHAHMLLPFSMGGIPEEWKKRKDPDMSDEFWDKEIEKLDLDPFFNLMKTNGTILDATLCVYKKMIMENSEMKWLGEIVTRITEKAHLLGVKISTGTDSDQTLFVPEEMEILVKFCGFTPIDAIVAATIIGAESIGISKTHGTIEIGKCADMLVLEKNPLEDILNINEVDFVIKNGQIFER